MAREYARIRLSINTDTDFEDLTPEGQWFYTRIVIPEPGLNHCGIFDWRPRRLLSKARGLTLDYIRCAAYDCEQGRFVLFDSNTEEGLARAYIRSEELLRNPKMAVAVIGAYRAIASKILRAAVVTEIRRANTEHPEYTSWKAGDVGLQLSEIMAQKSSDEVPYMDTITNPITNQIGNQNGNDEPVPIANRNTNMDPGADYQSESVPIPCSMQHAAITLQHAAFGGYETWEPHQGGPSGSPPQKICSRHPNGTDKPCRECGDIREAEEAQRQQQLTAKTSQLKRFWADVRAADCCDERGRIADGSGDYLIRCPNHDWSLVVVHA